MQGGSECLTKEKKNFAARTEQDSPRGASLVEYKLCVLFRVEDDRLFHVFFSSSPDHSLETLNNLFSFLLLFALNVFPGSSVVSQAVLAEEHQH